MTEHDGADTDGTQTTLQTAAREIHEHLEATAELPIDHRTNRWLGEAEAVAADAAFNDLDAETMAKRLSQVRHLLEEADAAGHPEADEHLEQAREVCARVLD